MFPAPGRRWLMADDEKRRLAKIRARCDAAPGAWEAGAVWQSTAQQDIRYLLDLIERVTDYDLMAEAVVLAIPQRNPGTAKPVIAKALRETVEAEQ